VIIWPQRSGLYIVARSRRASAPRRATSSGSCATCRIAAAAAMQQVVQDPDEVARRSALARRDLATMYSPERCGQMITARLAEIRAERAESVGDGLLEDGAGP